MDSDSCNVIYVDRNGYRDRLLEPSTEYLHETGDLRANLELLMNAFGHGKCVTWCGWLFFANSA